MCDSLPVTEIGFVLEKYPHLLAYFYISDVTVTTVCLQANYKGLHHDPPQLSSLYLNIELDYKAVSLPLKFAC